MEMSTDVKVHSDFDEYLDDILKALVDPISLELMLDPVMTVDNMTYERETIEQWFDYCEQHGRPYSSPVTNETLSTKELRPNISMKSILTPTIKYLESQDMIGNINSKAKSMLSRYREYEKEKAEKLAQDLACEAHFRALRVYCRRQHSMIFMRQNRVPSHYISQYRQVNVACDLCHISMIHRAPRRFYFNCTDCNFDVCEMCITADDFQQRIDNESTITNDSNILTGLDDMDDLQRLEELLRFVRPPPREERPSRISRFFNIFRNPFRSGNDGTRDENEPRCPRGHRMAVYSGRVPPMYQSAICDLCATQRLEGAGHEYFHCSRCSFDICHACMQIRLEQRQNP